MSISHNSSLKSVPDYMKNQLQLQQLQAIITSLSLEVAAQQTVLTEQSMFDNQLFKANKKQQLHYQLGDYISQVEENFSQLGTAVTNSNLEVVNYLTEKLLDQIAAIKKELASQKLRKRYVSKTKITPSLYQQIAQHHDYERRLTNMIYARENQLTAVSDTTEKVIIQREIMALEKRLQRCRQALSRLEHQLD